MWWSALIQPITGVFDKVLDSVLPDNMSEKEKEDMKLKMRVQVFNELQADREDMKNAREMAMKEMATDVWIVRLLRGLIRPVTGFLFVGMYIWAKISVQFGYQAITLNTNDYYIMGGILAFYFGMRSFVDKRNGNV